MKPFVALTQIGAFLIFMLTAHQGVADDQPFGKDSVKGKFIGVTGGAVLGAEVVMAVEGIVGIDKVWPYIVFPALGAGGGGVGGYFLEKKSVPGSVTLLIAGIALLIPTAILTTNAFAYNPEKEGATIGDDRQGAMSFELPPDTTEAPPAQEEGGAVTEVESKPDVGPPGPAALPPPGEPAETPAPAPESSPDAEEPAPESSPSAMRHSKRPLIAMGSLFNVDARDGRAGFGVPTPHIAPAQIRDERLQIYLQHGVEVVVPMLHIALP